MTDRHAPRLALALLERYVPDSAPLAGDLIEEFASRPSRAWFWCQVVTAIATAWLNRPTEIRPLRLVDAQPFDAIERSQQWHRRWQTVKLTATPAQGIGGLSLLVLGGVMTAIMPVMWLLLFVSMLSGAVCAVAIIALHRKPPRPATTIRVR